VPEKTGTIHIKWVRSGIGFPRQQRKVVRGLGLQRLNQVVERLDTANIRGMVAKVAHLVEVVEPLASPAWAGVPEYKIVPVGPAPKKAPPAEKAGKETPAESPAASEGVGAAATEGEVAAPRKRAGTAKSRTSESSKKEVSAASEKPKPRRKAAEPKSAAKEESKSKKGKK